MTNNRHGVIAMIGMMYFDSNKVTPFSAKVEEFIAQYKNRLGKDPKIVLVNEKDYAGRDTSKFSVPVRPDPYVLPNCFWVGEEKK